jgi:hypothetical protein
MTIVRHYPETTPEPTESPFPGYPLGVWPAKISSFCRKNATYETRHGDCSLPGCTCPCHSTPRLGLEIWSGRRELAVPYPENGLSLRRYPESPTRPPHRIYCRHPIRPKVERRGARGDRQLEATRSMSVIAIFHHLRSGSVFRLIFRAGS